MPKKDSRLDEIHGFLGQLALNNTREWMADHKDSYQQTRKLFEELVGSLIDGICQFDEGIQGQEAKKAIFRLHKDVRFSKDKSPYKLNYGASISKDGRKSPNASYYIHLMPGNNFIGGGMYMPQGEDIKKIRQEIDYNTQEFLKITKDGDFQNTFGGMQGDQLKTAPKGYPKDHPHIDILKFKGFYFLHNFDDEEVIKEGFIEYCLAKYRLLFPFVNYLNTAID